MTDKELDDLFQKSFSGHQMPVPSDMWDRVNPQKEKRRRGIILWWSGLGVAAMFVLVGTATWLYHTSTVKTMIATTAVKSINRKPVTGSAEPTKPFNQPSKADRKADLPIGSAKQELKLSSGSTSEESSQTTKSHIKTENHIAHLYINQNGSKQNSRATLNKLQNSTGHGANGIQKNIQENGIATTEQSNLNIQSNKDNNASELALSIDSTTIASSASQAVAPVPVQKPDSNAIAANSAATQQAKAAAVKVKKIHGEKATSFELMVAGYGNSRNVYDVDRFNRVGFVTSGLVNQKEKVLMNSFSINARIDKPVTKNISLKTGLQFLQTHQRVSYNYETVDQMVNISSSSNDTTVFARLQSKQSIVKGTYNSLSIPVLVSYHTNGTKFSLGATAGVLVNVLSWYGGKVPDAASSQVLSAESTFRSNTGTSLYGGITIAKQVGNFQLFAEPHIQYTLSSITKNSASFQQKITRYGFGIGIRKAIGK